MYDHLLVDPIRWHHRLRVRLRRPGRTLLGCAGPAARPGRRGVDLRGRRGGSPEVSSGSGCSASR